MWMSSTGTRHENGKRKIVAYEMCHVMLGCGEHAESDISLLTRWEDRSTTHFHFVVKRVLTTKSLQNLRTSSDVISFTWFPIILTSFASPQTKFFFLKTLWISSRNDKNLVGEVLVVPSKVSIDHSLESWLHEWALSAAAFYSSYLS